MLQLCLCPKFQYAIIESLVERKILCMSTILTELFASNFFTNEMPVNGMHVKFVRLGLYYH